MVDLYAQIARCHRWFYPEGNTFTEEPHTALRHRAATAQASEERIVVDNNDVINNTQDSVDESQTSRRPGRPCNTAPIVRNQPGILRFLTAFTSRPITPSTRSAPSTSTSKDTEVNYMDESDSDDEFEVVPSTSTSKDSEVNDMGESVSDDEFVEQM